jgi:sulfite exporter TauE/SafE
MFLMQCVHDIATAHGLAVSLFLAGLVGGFTHCAGMCSPFVLAQAGSVKKLSGVLLLPYHLGRMTTYVMLGVLVNTVINLALLTSELRVFVTAPLLVMAGVLFFVTAFPKLGALFPWVGRFGSFVPYRFISKFMAGLSENPGVLKRYGMGVLLGFMPCGLVLAALMAAFAAPSPFHAALYMIFFTLGTIPALIMVAFGGKTINQRFPRAGERLKQGAMIVSGLWLFLVAGLMIF